MKQVYTKILCTMAIELMLRRTADETASYIQRYVTLAAAEKREEVLDLFDKMSRLLPHLVIMTCPVMHPDIHYVSENTRYVLGHDSPELLNTNLATYFTKLHPADQEDLHECFTYAYDFLRSLSPQLHYQYRFVFHYRFKKQNGQYIYVHDEKAALKLRGDEHLYYSLMRDMTTGNLFNGVKVELLKQEYTLNRITEYKPSAKRNALTKREGELVALIKQGLSTKEIAWYLKISHNTVRNIKSKLFEKYNVNNTIELLNVTA